MTEKSRIVASLGEQKLLLPELVNAALAANDRVKYYFTLLQAARTHAEHPDTAPAELHRERVACGVADGKWDEVPANAGKVGEGRYRIPGAGDIVRNVGLEVETLLRPLAGKDAFAHRFEELSRAQPQARDDEISAGEIDALASGSRERGDTFHLLVMDAHKALNALQREIAVETLEGASVYGIHPSDQEAIRAFMRGVQRTAPLKFDHPGLGTTATRAGKRLVIQNDIGTTDAHVLVVHVEGRKAEITYTDVHLQRLLFFQTLLSRYAVRWSDTVSRRDAALEDGVYHMSVGSFEAADDGEMHAYLEHVGSRLVFLIDWNRARKRLRALVSRKAALSLLAWSARQDHGHVAFLAAGGEQLVYDALDFVLKGQAHFGDRLDDLLGAESAAEYLRFVLKTCAESLTRGEPDTFIQDAVRAELFNYFRTGRQHLYDIAAEHAALIFEIAGAVRDSVVSLQGGNDAGATVRHASRAKQWEQRADDIVNRARASPRQPGGSDAFATIVAAADDAADELEEAAFRLTLLPPGAAAHCADLAPLAGLLVHGAQEYVKLVETARYVRRGGVREDMQDFLDAVHHVMAVERASDAAQREFEASITRDAADFRSLYLLGETTKNLEEAADALLHCSLRVRDFVLGQVQAS